MIDYIVTNKKIHPLQTLDVRTHKSANVGSDHNLLLGKIMMRIGRKKTTEKSTEEKYNVEALWYESSKDLYQRRLTEKIVQNLILHGDDARNS